MIKTTYTYPGDPTEEVTLMFGAEFVQANPDRYIAVGVPGDMHKIPVTEIVCDSCNTSVSDTDPCSVTVGRLYCWECHEKWVKPHMSNKQVSRV